MGNDKCVSFVGLLAATFGLGLSIGSMVWFAPYLGLACSVFALLCVGVSVYLRKRK